MFYWNRGGTFVLLTHTEEMSLVRELSGDIEDIFGYHVSRDTRQNYERRIANHLTTMSRRDPEGFRRQYVHRSLHGADARTFFPHMLDAYGRATHLATFGVWSQETILDELVEGVIHANAEEVFHISLLSRVWWNPRGYRIKGKISFPAETIRRLVGEVSNFVLMTDAFDIHFRRDFIRVSVHGRSPSQA